VSTAGTVPVGTGGTADGDTAEAAAAQEAASRSLRGESELAAELRILARRRPRQLYGRLSDSVWLSRLDSQDLRAAVRQLLGLAWQREGLVSLLKESYHKDVFRLREFLFRRKMRGATIGGVRAGMTDGDGEPGHRLGFGIGTSEGKEAATR